MNIEEEQNLNEPQNQKLNIGAVSRSFSFGELLKIIHEKDPESKYAIQYSGYEDNQWTVESLLLPHRIETIKNDNSIRKVFIKFSNGTCLVVVP